MLNVYGIYVVQDRAHQVSHELFRTSSLNSDQRVNSSLPQLKKDGYCDINQVGP